MADVRRPRPRAPLEVESDDSLPTAYLRPGEADRVLAGHPWIYEGCLLRFTKEPADGEVVQVKDHRRRFLGVGFYNSKSKIRIRVLAHQRVELNGVFFGQRLRDALAHRQRFLPGATSFRLVNAEGDLLSGLIIDKYEDVLVLQTSSLGMDRQKPILVDLLKRLLKPRAIVERNDAGSRKFEGLPESNGVLYGQLEESEMRALPVVMNGLRFEADVLSGHKTGLYLDQQVNQSLVAGFARDARVLDAFSFQGGFALHAARAGARSVIGIDQSETAVTSARRIAQSNGLTANVSFETANVFDWMRSRSTPAAASSPDSDPQGAPKNAPLPEASLFDTIVLDPPSFTRNRASVPDALRGYKEIHLRALRLLKPGGVLATFCCSHHVDAGTFGAVIDEAAFDARRILRRVATYGQSPDHPVLTAIPETEYLKGYAYEVLAP